MVEPGIDYTAKLADVAQFINMPEDAVAIWKVSADHEAQERGVRFPRLGIYEKYFQRSDMHKTPRMMASVFQVLALKHQARLEAFVFVEDQIEIDKASCTMPWHF